MKQTIKYGWLFQLFLRFRVARLHDRKRKPRTNTELSIPFGFLWFVIDEKAADIEKILYQIYYF